ncbi:hypothetical protein M407DRAFT_18193 [Tulasnella calospora MUT 4182]|uniref:Protein kinase domain-containing protein n=1 Tax=Tulasnella calospora MUT 4182 TaxID=1051891 RepID=A0A0C3QKI9_9AGAM|nr:hypothetical protein M407DRAFT_18193 [Tulasnella calospora MUT 4182]
MSGSINEKEEANRSTSAQVAVGEEVEDATNSKRLEICPRKVLESLSHLRIDGARIKPIEGQSPKAGRTAEVEAAILASAQESDSSESNEKEYVAVKKLRFDGDTDDDRTLAPLADEVNLLNDLSHENVVRILGFVEDAGQGVAWMVFAWEQNGNLREFIRSEKWKLPERVSLIDDVAKGLRYLHGRDPPICHGDLKSLNILVNPGNRAVITDFGSARAVDSVSEEALESARVARSTPTARTAGVGAQEAEALTAEMAPSGDFITMTGPAWTVRWAAPEQVRGDSPGLASDIWGLGWICWEAVTGNFLFEKENNNIAIVRITTGDLPPVENDDQFHQIKALCSLMMECWKLDTSERPAAAKCGQIVSDMNPIVPSSREVGSLSVTRSSGLLYALGRVQLGSNMYSKAQEYFEQCLKVAESVGDERGKPMAVNGIGDVYRMRNEYSKAEESYTQARDIFSQIGDQLGFAQSVDSLGDVYLMRDEYSKAEELYIQARDIFSQIGDQLGSAQSVKSLGDVFRMRSKYSKAEESYIQARDIYSQIGDQLGFAQSVKSLGDVYRMRDEYSKAEESYIQARDIDSQIGDQLGFAQSVKGLGDVYRMRNEYSKAEESYIQARDIFSQIGNQLGFAQSVDSLGDVYLMRNKDSKAEESYIQARNIYSQIGDQLGFAQSIQSLGDMYRMRNEYSKAEESYIQARDIFSQIGDQLGFARSVKGLGDVYQIRDEYSRAEESYIQARDIFSQIGDQLGFAQSSEGMGRVYAARKEYARAEESYSQAERIYHRIGDMHSSANILWFRGWLHRNQGHWGESVRLVAEASTIYRRLGLEEDVEDCDEFLEDIRPLIE